MARNPQKTAIPTRRPSQSDRAHQNTNAATAAATSRTGVSPALGRAGTTSAAKTEAGTNPKNRSQKGGNVSPESDNPKSRGP